MKVSINECVLCGPDHPDGLTHTVAEIAAYEKGRADLLAKAVLRPCHVTGMHNPEHHLLSEHVCSFQATEIAESIAGELETLPRSLHGEDCYWCHRSEQAEKGEHQAWVEAARRDH